MGLLFGLLLLPVTGPLRGLLFITEQFQEELEAQLHDEGRVLSQLVELSLRHDRGEITGPAYEAEEAALLEELDAIRAYQESLLSAEGDGAWYDEEDAYVAPC